MKNNVDTPNTEIKGLNENHIRAISVTLCSIEQDIDEIERYIKDIPKGRMYEIEDDLRDEQKERILRTVKSLKECINEFANALNLKADKVSLNGIVRGKLTIHWANVCDIEAKNLKAYGMVGKDTREVLDFHIQRLIALLRGDFKDHRE